LEINRIQPYENNGTPSVICCTQEGLYYLTDYVPNTENEINIEANYKLSNFPNPFNPTTTISFELNTETSESIELSIYNLKGQKVKSYHINQSTVLPINSVTWDGKDDKNQPVSSGIYFYKLQSGDIEVSKKMLLLK